MIHVYWITNNLVENNYSLKYFNIMLLILQIQCLCTNRMELTTIVLFGFPQLLQHSNQYSICGKTRGGQQCIFDIFWLFFWGSIQTWVVERHQMGFKVGIHSRGSNRSEYEPGSVTNEN